METLIIKIPDEKSLIVKQVLKDFGVTILESDFNDKSITLTPDQREEIISSQTQIECGLYVEQSTLDDEIKTWLKK